MNVVVLQVFVSLMLVVGSLLLFVHSVRQRDHEHADRMALAPLEDDNLAPTVHSTAAHSTTTERENKGSKESVCRRNG